MTAVPIDRPYLLVTFIPYFVDDEDAVWIERLWHKDLVLHVPYLPRLTVAAPRLSLRPAGDLVRVDVPGVKFIALPAMRTTLESVRALPATTLALWRAVGDTDIVHSGVVGWPFPIGWIANPIALLRKKELVLVVESTPWRTADPTTTSLGKRLRAVVTEHLARLYVNRGDVVFFTHDGYRDSLLKRSERGHVIAASWIDDDVVLHELEAERAWDQKSEAPLRVLFAGRLVREKGVQVLLEAARILQERNAAVRISFIGEGPLAAEIRAAGCTLHDPVPYGPAFFSVLREHHVVVVPTLSDEQPRILFDAAAQAVAVLASDSPGNRSFVVEGDTGLLVPTGNPVALADALAASVGSFRALGLRALRKVRGHTHRAMHTRRWQVLAQTVGGPL